MGLLSKGRVNMIVTSTSIRYGYQRKGGVTVMKHIGEQPLREGTFNTQGELQNSVYFEDALKAILKRHSWKGATLAYAFVDDSVYIHHAEAEGKLSDAEVVQYIRTHDGAVFELPFEYSALAVDVLTDNSKKSLATKTAFRLYAYPLDKFDKLNETFKAVGLKPVASELTGMSVYRYYLDSLKRTGAESKQHVLVVHWNVTGVYITMFSRGKAVFNRHIRIEVPKHVTAPIVNDLIDDVIADISKLVDFYQTSIIATVNDNIEADMMLDEDMDADDEDFVKPELSSDVERLVVTGDFDFIDMAQKKLDHVFDIEIYDLSEGQSGEDTYRKKGQKKKRTSAEMSISKDDSRLGKYGRSTRVSTFSLEHAQQLSAGNYANLKYVDLLGLGLKSSVKAGV